LEPILNLMLMLILMRMKSQTFEDYWRTARLGILRARFVEASGQVSCIG
jgi:hypothetical protein